jgi:hypothetical protein
VPTRSVVRLAVLISVLIVQPGVVQPVLARGLPLTLVDLTASVSPGREARLTVQTDPHTQCMLLWHYKTRAGETDMVLPKRADGAGRAEWIWRLDRTAVPGTWPLIVHCTDEFKGNVEQRRLELRFVVR